MPRRRNSTSRPIRERAAASTHARWYSRELVYRAVIEVENRSGARTSILACGLCRFVASGDKRGQAGRDDQRDERRERQATDHGDGERTLQLRTRADSKRERCQACERRNGGHDDRAETATGRGDQC